LKRTYKYKKSLDKFNLALEYKSDNNYTQSIKLLLEAIADIRKDRNTIYETQLIADFQSQLADIYMDIGEVEKALEFFQKAIINGDMVLSNSSGDNIKLIENQALNLIDMAILYRTIEEFDEAISHYHKAIERYDLLIKLEPLELKYLEDKASTIYDIAETYAHIQDNDNASDYIIEAENISNQIKAQEPYSVTNINRLGAIYMIKAQISDQTNQDISEVIKYLNIAISFYNLAINIEPKDIESIKNRAIAEITLADIYFQKHDTINKALTLFKTAIKSFDNILIHNSNDEVVIISRVNAISHIGIIYKELGEIYLALDYFNQALKEYKKILEDNPNNYEIIDHIGVNLNNIANIYISLKNKKDVEDILLEAIDKFDTIIEATDIDAYDRLIIKESIYNKAIAQIDLSRFYIEIDKLDKAISILKEVISISKQLIIDEPNTINYINQKALAKTILAEIYETKGQISLAIDTYQEAILLFDKSIEIKSNDIFTINHRGLAKADIMIAYIYSEQLDKASKFFEEAIIDYDLGLALNPNFTDIVINRATLIGDWISANQSNMKYQDIVKAFEESIQNYDKVLETQPFHYTAMNNRLTVSSDLAQLYSDNNQKNRAIEILYDEYKWYQKILEIYPNDLMSLMNAGVSKLILANYLIENREYEKALVLLKESIDNYELVLQSNPNDIETLSNKSLTLREIIRLEKSSNFLNQSIETNQQLLYLYDYYFIGIEEENDTFNLTNRMLYPISTLIYSYYLDDREDNIEVLKALELSKSKNLNMLMRSAIEYDEFNFDNDTQKNEFLEIKTNLSILKEKIRDIKIEVEDKKEEKNIYKGLKGISIEEKQRVQSQLDYKLLEKDELYNEFHKQSKKLANLLSIKEFDDTTIYEDALSLLTEESILLYPIYYREKSEINIVTVIKQNDKLFIDITHDRLDYAPNFSDIIFFIKDIKLLLSLSDERLITQKLKSIEKKYKNIDYNIFDMIFTTNKDRKIINIKVSYSSFVARYRYEILQKALSFLSDTISKSIPSKTQKIYFSPFGDLNMIPLHAIPIGEDKYLIDDYEIIYIPSLSIWSGLKRETISNNNLENNLFVSQDKIGEYACYNEAKICSKYMNTTPINNIDSMKFKEIVHNQKFNILHLSVHGSANLSNPLSSYLAFRNSHLSLLEIHGLKLKANLVILSACETNLSSVEGADEILAFERGFMIAGATNIISTFDEVDTQRTQEFMLSFYQNLKNSDSFAQCFQQTAIIDIESNSMEWMFFRFSGVE